jgi:dethiobiotin synthetase
MKRELNNTLFVTGTDTSVGKTYVCARLLEFFKNNGTLAGYQKWVATGSRADLPDDLTYCLDAASISPTDEPVEQQVPYSFRYPASPHLAAEMEKRTVEPEIIIKNYHIMAAKYKWLIVEGVGGIMVPLRRDLLLADLLARLRPRTLVVARSGLGTLNHTLLTLEALQTRKIPVLGVIFTDQKTREDDSLVEDNMQIIKKIGGVKVLGRLRWQQNITKAKTAFISVGHAILEQLLQAP